MGEVDGHSRYLDRSQLEEVTGGDIEFLTEIIDLYLEDSALQMAGIAEAIEAGDSETLNSRAHTLKGSSANVGAVAMRDLANELEQMGKSSDIDGAAKKLPSLQEAFEKIKLVMTEIKSDS